ncbi:MAG: hypothetical protein ACLSE4_04005 [Clostridium sp.]
MLTQIYILLMTAGRDIAFIVVWTLVVSGCYIMIMFPPRRMLFVRKETGAITISWTRLMLREDKYEICEVVSYKKGMA